MKTRPKPREGVYELYWRFAAERQKVFERRLEGKLPPWSADPIISKYKFCNTFRACDRVSQYLIREVCYHRDEGDENDRAFQIVAFRLFSRIETWDAIRAFLGGRHPTVADLRTGQFLRAIEHARRLTKGLYTNAFILCATDAFGHREKHLNHVALLKAMFQDAQLTRRMLSGHSMRNLYTALHDYPLIGDFMAYQLSIDLNYSELVDYSENEFTQPGPGALRGLKKVFTDLGDFTPAEAIAWMVDSQNDEFRRHDLEFSGLWGRELHAIDCQGLFCETDKYCREAAPELVSSRKRIKAKFTPSRDPLQLFFPPKWNINDRLPAGDVVEGESQQRLFAQRTSPTKLSAL